MISIKKGRYAILNGEEYKVYSNQDHSFDLISHDVKNGFIEQYPNTYVKKVSVSEITNIYRIISYAKYRGNLFDVNDQDKNGYRKAK